jgi:hypothetical protein
MDIHTRSTAVARTIAAMVVFAVLSTACSGSSNQTAASTTGPDSTQPALARSVECTPENGWSIARLFNEQALDAIRRDFPAPTTHARNLYHLSAAMWDAWAAYEPDATGVFFEPERTHLDDGLARDDTIAYAAFRILRSRYERAAFGSKKTLAALNTTMRSLCLDPAIVDSTGVSPAALGNRIAQQILDATVDDGSNERGDYAAVYSAKNPTLVIAQSGTELLDPDHWQPLEFDRAFSQHGQPLPSPIQSYVGPQWGSVTPFALETGTEGLPIDPGPPPLFTDPETRSEYVTQAIEVIDYSSRLDPNSGVDVDISPGTLGDNTLGTNNGAGHTLNPTSGEPYAPNVVAEGDFGRTVAEFWADGPKSETPPGHWNTIANAASDDPSSNHHIAGTRETKDRLEWDVSLYLALNGALHDAAIAAWGAKAYYDSVRPISTIRWLSGNGQSTDPTLRSYSPNGITLVDGLVEVIDETSSAPGGRHEDLRDHVGEIAVLAWQAHAPGLPETTAGVGWIRGVDWLPYQSDTFVTPAFPGYVSGHSAFSRAAAEVLAAITADPYFPSGLSSWDIENGSLKFEQGPSDDIVLQWATYFDAADQAGASRLYGGIHITADDLLGRELGAEVGRAAWAKALTYLP